MSGALINHETNMMINHVVLLLPVDPGNSYSWRWKRSIIIQTQKTRDAIAKTAMQAQMPQKTPAAASSPAPP